MTAVTLDTRPIRIFLADEVERVRQAVRDLVELQPDMVVVGEAADGATATALIPHLTPDVVLLDARLTEQGGTPALLALIQRTPRIPVVIYAANPRPGDGPAALAAGAAAFVEKDVLPHDLLRVLREAAGGQPDAVRG